MQLIYTHAFYKLFTGKKYFSKLKIDDKRRNFIWPEDKRKHEINILKYFHYLFVLKETNLERKNLKSQGEKRCTKTKKKLPK